MEKTEKATPKKRGEARRKGQVARSSEIPSAAIFLLMFAVYGVLGGMLMRNLLTLLKTSIVSFAVPDLTVNGLKEIFIELGWELAKMLWPFMLSVMLIAMITNWMQFGFLFTAQTLKMDVKRLNPISGLKRIFALRALVELAKSVLKFVLIASVLLFLLWSQVETFITLSQLPVLVSMAYIGKMLVSTGLIIGALLLLLAFFDLAYTRFEHAKSLRMTKQEVKDERKNAEGDPKLKSHIRQKQRSFALARMMQDVPRADVVITNPTHYAVALRYSAGETPAPTVVAKGVDYLALRIRQIAEENDVALVENPPLARALYAQLEVGQEIPGELYQAVAEVLAYVYRVRENVR